MRSLTRVKELGPDESAILEEGFGGSDVLEGAVHKQRVFKLHRLHLDVDEPARTVRLDMMSRDGLCLWRGVQNILVVDVFSFFVNLVFQGEVEMKLLHLFSVKHFQLGFILLVL